MPVQRLALPRGGGRKHKDSNELQRDFLQRQNLQIETHWDGAPPALAAQLRGGSPCGSSIDSPSNHHVLSASLYLLIHLTHIHISFFFLSIPLLPFIFSSLAFVWEPGRSCSKQLPHNTVSGDAANYHNQPLSALKR